jgi:DNA repair protein RadC
MIKDMPLSVRPREKLTSLDSSELSTIELLAILLRSGTKKQSVIELSSYLVYKYGSLKNLASLNLDELLEIDGIGLAKATTLIATFELSKRIAKSSFKEQCFINSVSKVNDYIAPSLINEKQEILVVLYLNSKGYLIKEVEVFKGTLNASLIHPREIFKYAVVHSAASFIMVHNHPSGDPTPSQADKSITESILQLSDMMNIKLLDHVIIGDNLYYSFQEHDLLK